MSHYLQRRTETEHLCRARLFANAVWQGGGASILCGPLGSAAIATTIGLL